MSGLRSSGFVGGFPFQGVWGFGFLGFRVFRALGCSALRFEGCRDVRIWEFRVCRRFDGLD